MNKKILFFLMAIVLMASSAQADVSYHAAMPNCKNQSGTPIANGTFLMILDLDGDGVGAPNPASWVWDANDLILQRGPIVDGRAFPSRVLFGDPAAISGYNAGVDKIYVLWFDTPYQPLPDGNFDGVVNQADYDIWRSGYGLEGHPSDYNGNGVNDAADYVVWRKNNGATSTPGAGVRYGVELLAGISAAFNGQTLTPIAAGGNAGLLTSGSGLGSGLGSAPAVIEPSAPAQTTPSRPARPAFRPASGGVSSVTAVQSAVEQKLQNTLIKTSEKSEKANETFRPSSRLAFKEGR